MKTIILTALCLLVCHLSPQAQILYGTTAAGGSQGGGTINKFDAWSNTLTVIKNFESIADGKDYPAMTQGRDGKLYGVASNGGLNNYGFIFSFDPVSLEYSNLKNFDKTNGANPSGSMVLASNGLFYGGTSHGGSSDNGVIYSFDPNTRKVTKLKDFAFQEISRPSGAFIQAADSKLYGLTFGTRFSAGIFSYDISTSTYTNLASLGGTGGSGGLIQASDGKLYGTTLPRTINDTGTIFSFDPISSVLTTVKNFLTTDGRYPYGALIQGKDNKLYGTTTSGGLNNLGVIYSYDPVSSVFTKLKDFDIPGSYPGSLFQVSDGQLYGVIGSGSDYGGIFSLDLTSSAISIKIQYDVFKGKDPVFYFTNGNDGKLYGITSRSENTISRGLIFSLDLSNSTYLMVKDLGIAPDGSNVTGALVKASNKNLYGMTTHGGTKGYGVIFSLDSGSNLYTKLFDFDFNHGAKPLGNLMQASNGLLYGMTERGGINDRGVLFSFDIATSLFQKLKDFNFTDGAWPKGGLIQASDGNLYGMTELGVIFSFDPETSIFQNKGVAGFKPYGNLMQASNEKLYGMTTGRDNNFIGSFFSYDILSSGFDSIAKFSSFEYVPYGNLIQGKDGKLYAMAASFDTDGGVIFSIDSLDPSSPLPITVLKDLNSIDGSRPLGSLLQASNGKFYGMTYKGGSTDQGVIFSLEPSTGTYTRLQDFNGANGAYPYYGSSFVETGPVPHNSPPVLTAIGNQSVNEQESLQFTATGIDNDTPSDFLSFALATVATGKFPAGAHIDLHTGLFSWTPSESQGPGEYRVKVIVFDGTISDKEEIVITVLERNSPPALTSIGTKEVIEGSALEFTPVATDTDLPANILTFSLASPASGLFPGNASINPASGLFSWTPSEAQGPGKYRVKVIVSDGTASAEEVIDINVNEINSPPVLAAVGDQHIDDNATLNFSAIVTDVDLPSNPLTFSLIQAVTGKFPDGATINSTDGTFSWSPLKGQIPGIYRVKIVVSDGLLTDEEEIQITVRRTGSEIFLTSYPNPSAKLSTIIFSVPANEENVTLEVCDTRGRRVGQFYEGKATAFEPYIFQFDGSRLSPGIYLLRLHTLRKSKSFRIILTE